MSELAAWLLERITEDEAACQAATDDPEWVGGRLVPLRTRLLAECAAKRSIVALHRGKETDGFHECVGGQDAWGFVTEYAADCTTLCLLAQPYAGAPGWRDEWA